METIALIFLCLIGILVLIGMYIIHLAFYSKIDDIEVDVKVEKLPLSHLHDVVKEYSIEKVYMKSSPVHGRGIYAACDIKAGEIIEIAPIILEECDKISPALADYFMQVPGCNTCAYGFGYYSFYNDSADKDADFKLNIDEKKVYVVAVKDIPKDKEIFMSYGEKYWESRGIDRTTI